MSEETEIQEAEAPEAAEAQTEGEAPQQSAEPSYEDRALAMGWTPKTQFKGDPEKWVDAETFVKRGEEFLPFLKANNRRLEQALEKANAKIASLDKAVRGSIEHISKAEQRAYTRARADLEAELEQAAAAGDAETVKAVTKDIVALEKEVSAKPEKDEPDTPPEMAEWLEANPWFGKDRAMTAACQAIANDVFEEGYTGKAQLREVDKRIRAEFPHKFEKPENPNRKAPAAVEGFGSTPRPRGKSYSDLPPEAKQMCDEFCRDIKGMTREKYVREYFKEQN